MTALKFEDLPETIRGRKAELAVSQMLQGDGWHVLPAYDYSGKGGDKAPRLCGVKASLIVPDLLAARLGVVTWFEVKWKHQASRGWTGIPLRHWRHYMAVKEVTGAEVWLVFVHEAEDEVRMGEIGDLLEKECPHDWGRRAFRTYEGNRMTYGGMAFYCWDCLVPLCRTTDILAAVP